MSLRRRLCWVLALSCVGGVQAAEVLIYRCTDARGRLTLRDTPCVKGEQQQTRAMLRPTDPPRRAAPREVAPATARPSAPATTRIIVIQPARPLYECTAPDGARYTSDSGEGNPRWMPLWTLGYPVWGGGERFDNGGFSDGGVQARIGGRFDNGRFDVRIGDGRGGRMRGPPLDRPGPPSRPPVGPPVFVQAYPAGTWVRDECHALPAQEVCARLRDRRFELDRRYNSALQSERVQITNEQRGIDARLSNDCGADY